MRFLNALFASLFLLSLLSVTKAEIQPIAEQILSTDINSDNLYAAVYSPYIEGVVRAYDVGTYELVSEVNVCSDPVPKIKVYGDRLYAASYDGVVYIYSISPELSYLDYFRATNVSLIWIDVDDNYIYTYNTLGEVLAWNSSDYSLAKVIEITDERLLFSSDGNNFYGASSYGVLKARNISDWSVLAETDAGTEMGDFKYIESFHTDDDFVYTAFNDGRWEELTALEVWNKPDLTLHFNMSPNKLVTHLASDSENLYAVVRNTGEVLVYGKPDFELKETIVYDDPERFSSASIQDGKIFVASHNGTIGVFDISDFSLLSLIGTPSYMDRGRFGEIETRVNPLPVALLVILILVLNIFIPEKTLEKVKKRFEDVSVNDIFMIFALAGVIILLVLIVNPAFVSDSFTSDTAISQYFDVFIRNNPIGYYWFLIWPVFGYWIFNKKGRKIASISSGIFLGLAYLLFIFLP
jgi:WD40 repeat protein